MYFNSIAWWIFCCAMVLAVSCQEGEKKQESSESEEVSAPVDNEKPSAPAPTDQFDIKSVSISDKNIGQFPYFSPPDGLSVQVEDDKQFHRVYHVINGKLVPIEGRTYAISLRGKDGKDFEPLLFERNYENLIKSAGGVLVSDKRAEKTEIDRVGKDELFKYGGVADIYNESVKAYVIRRPNCEIWVQLSANNAMGTMLISETGEMKQSSKFLDASEIKQQLDEKGKAVLHIQFDTDKVTLQPEGEQAVDQIAKLLKTNTDIQLAINGHTDNSGSEAHNLKLSIERAAAVMNAVVKSGVDKGRLSSEGLGASAPIAENSTEDGKAKNRRVELIRK